jgi:HlyD family secretion protein
MKLLTESMTYSRVRWGLCAGLVLVAAIPTAVRWMDRAEASTQLSPDREVLIDNRGITAPGRIQPRDGVLTLAAPAAAFGAAIVSELHVREGDWVEREQVLAVLHGRIELEAEVAASERRIDVAQAKLAALRSAAKREDILALEAEVRADEAHVAQISTDTARTVQLKSEGVVSAAALEAQQARLSVAERTLDAKRARLAGLSNARPADLAVAAAELSAAQADAQAAGAKLSLQFVRAPSSGRVLRIHAFPGQAVGAQGVLSFAQTAEMFVDAEIMEHDIARARIGQAVRITGDSLGTPLEGTVERVGTMVGPREVFAIDPTAFSDSRIVHVLIRVNEPAAAERLINARVTVEIRS